MHAHARAAAVDQVAQLELEVPLPALARGPQEDGSEPALVGPWTMGRDKKNPKPLDQSAFNTLVKTASEVIRRHEQSLQATLHKEIAISCTAGRITVVDVPRITPLAFPLLVDSTRAKVSSEKLADRVRRMTTQAERATQPGAAMVAASAEPSRRKTSPEIMRDAARRPRPSSFSASWSKSLNTVSAF